MELIFLNSDFEDTYILDTFKSLIWTDRFWECGDFDLSVSPSNQILSALEDTLYFRMPSTSHKMVLETVNIKTDIEEGDLLVVQGRSLESLLDRRIVWSGTALSGNFQDAIEQLLDDSFISPTDSDREVSNFAFLSNSESAITSLTIDTQFIGKNVYDVVCELCKSRNIGFRVFQNPNDGMIRFKLLAGVDRSYSQSTNAHVAFTENLDNLMNSEYIETDKFLKTVALVAGEEGVGNVRTLVEVPAPGGSLTGLNRREMYIEANVRRNSPDGELSESEYLDQLEGKGVEELAKKIYIEALDGEVDTTMYTYGTDFDMGDILQIADSYGHSTRSRVTEMIFSQNLEGERMYPTFETVDD
jgi:hypothetical protein